MGKFRDVSPQVNLPDMEQGVLAFWKQNAVFQKTVEQTQDGPRYVFYEGPPTANGRPGIHHVLARAFKDIFPRYKTMRGYFVSRKGGWDTHGLPVELEVEKKLGLLRQEGDRGLRRRRRSTSIAGRASSTTWRNGRS